jgi:23S rRNA pseudouridine1911/1915/1917 synthase
MSAPQEQTGHPQGDGRVPPDDRAPIQVLYEDNHLIAVNKRPSEIVQGDSSGDEPLSDRVRAYLKKKYKKPGDVYLGVVHRLDRPTSGALLFARTSKALGRMNALFRDDRVEKLYWALVQERPPREQDTLVHYLRRNPEQNKSYAYDHRTSGAKKASLSYLLRFSLERYHLLEIRMHTGRHHQIRAQLHRIGCHIKGDLKYGAPRSNPGGGIHLHAREITFPHPVAKRQVRIVADPPPDPLWDAVMARLGAAGDSGDPPLAGKA